MADEIDVEVTGKSKFEVAQGMAFDILFRIEKKNGWESVSRADYLNAVVDSIYALGGSRPE
ncbi:hypothetical protein SAMN05443247_01731 [Bradyrhizobium erythrophlei]|jgi:hypothetical protein|nr:hypothetical protein SAMN05443247_01731 [Bradyrhizobium erythrophlei]